MKQDRKNKWYLITIDNIGMINGDGFFNIINLIKTVQKFKYVILNDIEGSPKSDHKGLVAFFQYQEGKVLLLQDYLKDVTGVLQFDWADFFLFKKKPENWICYELYSDNIEQTDTTVRAIDGQYIYIYTPNHEIVDLVKSKFNIESLKFDLIEKLDYPY